MKLLLLPGMDGTGLLFRRLLCVLPKDIEPIVHAYDMQQLLGYDALFTALPALDEPHAILGESFSGPLAIRRAAQDKNVHALILIASFERAPRPVLSLFSMLSRQLFQRPPPRAVVKHLLIGPCATDDLVDEVHQAIASVRGDVLANRLKQIANVDVRSELAGVRCPLLYLQGKHDRLVPQSCGERITQGQHRTLSTLDAWHLLLQSRPDASAARIAQFLMSPEASGPSG